MTTLITEPPRLTEIWVRKPTDLFDRKVPIKVEKLVADDKMDVRHMVQVPPGVELVVKPTMPEGVAVMTYSDGTYRKYSARKRDVMINGATLKRRKAR